jgi:histone deacetylase complex regulatory component SIN3
MDAALDFHDRMKATFADALDYNGCVKARFADEPEVFNTYVDTLVAYKSRRSAGTS